MHQEKTKKELIILLIRMVGDSIITLYLGLNLMAREIFLTVLFLFIENSKQCS